MTSKATDKRAVIYVRVSTKSQDEQYSPTAQLEKCRAFAKQHGLTIVREFKEAASARKGQTRAEFQRMLEFIKEKKIPGVVFAWRDRIQRNLEDYVALKPLVTSMHDVEAGVSFNPNDPDDYQAISDYGHDMVDAKKFSDRLSKRVRESYDGLVSKGHWPHSLPLGYDREKGGKIIIDPDRGPLIQTMFRLFASGTFTRKAITAKMRALGLRSRQDRSVVNSQIEAYLKNPFYAGGQFRWKGQVYKSAGDWEPLISHDLFDEVQAVFAAKRTVHRRDADYKYKGLFVCGLCGCAYVQEDKKYRYYRCTYQKKACNKLRSPRLKESELDRLLDVALDTLEVDPMIFEQARNEIEETYRLTKETEEVERGRLEAELKSVGEQRTRAFQSFTKGLVADEGLVREEIARLSDRKAEIETRLQELSTAEETIVQNSLDVLGILKDFKNQYFSVSPEKRRRMNFLLFRKVTVHPIKRTVPELMADPKVAMEKGDFPLHIVWTEPFQWLADRYRMRGWTIEKEAEYEAFFEDYLATPQPQKQRERA